MKNFIKSIVMTLSFSIFFDTLSHAKTFEVVYSAMLNNPIALIFVFIGLFYFLNKTSTLTIKTSFLQKVVSGMFAIGTLFTDVYSADVLSINEIISGNKYGIVLTFLRLISYYWLFEEVQRLFVYLYEKRVFSQLHIKNKVVTPIFKRFEKNPFLFTLVVLLVAWGLIALMAYPAVFMGDTMDQIMQVFNAQQRTDDHPVLSTMFTGYLVKLGSMLGSANFGIFLVVITQVVLVALIFAFSVRLLTKVSTNNFFAFLIVWLLALIPSTSSTIILPTKDVLFSAFFVVYVITLFIYFYDRTLFKTEKLGIYHCVAIVLMLLFRYNTLHFVAATLLIYFITIIFSKKSRKQFTMIIVLGLVSLVVGKGVNSVLVSSFSEVNIGSDRRKMLSVPFQHTARYIRYHEDEITPEDKKIIDSVLDYDVIKKEYIPYLSDPVNRTHKGEATSEEMSAYFKLVFREAKAHPLVAFESLAASHASLFNLNRSMNNYYINGIYLDDPPPKSYVKFVNDIGLHDNSRSRKWTEDRVDIYRFLDRLPFLSQLNNYGFYLFLLFSMCVIYLRDKKYQYAGVILPCFFLTGTLLLGPITLGYVRYMLPLIFVAPLLAGFFVATDEKRNELE